MRRTTLTHLFLLAVVTVAGCGEQDAPDFLGETLGLLQGTVKSDLPEPLPPADLMLSWPDYSTGAGGAVPISTFQRIELNATLPAQFSAQLLQPPPDSAYTPPLVDPLVVTVSPRTAVAHITLVRHGATVSDDSAPIPADYSGPVLASFDSYLLFYSETTGNVGFEDADGVLHVIGVLTKGYHLWRQDRTYCSRGVDQTCLDEAMAQNNGTLTPWNVYQCSNVVQQSFAGRPRFCRGTFVRPRCLSEVDRHERRSPEVPECLSPSKAVLRAAEGRSAPS